MLTNLGLFALRVTLGLVFLGHGAQKSIGAFGGPGFAGATGFIGNLGFRPARLWAGLAVGGELLAGSRPLASASPRPAPPLRTSISPALQSAGVTPLSVLFNNSAINYTLSNSSGSVGIAGLRMASCKRAKSSRHNSWNSSFLSAK